MIKNDFKTGGGRNLPDPKLNEKTAYENCYNETDLCSTVISVSQIKPSAEKKPVQEEKHGFIYRKNPVRIIKRWKHRR